MKVLKQAKYIELLLYHNAISFSDYIDTRTLLQRISMVVRTIQKNEEVDRDIVSEEFIDSIDSLSINKHPESK